MFILGREIAVPTVKRRYFLFSKKFQMSIVAILLCFSKYIFDIIKFPILIKHYLICALFTSLSLVFILFYNKKQGPKVKYFFYIFYPLHLFILYLINIVIY